MEFIIWCINLALILLTVNSFAFILFMLSNFGLNVCELICFALKGFLYIQALFMIEGIFRQIMD